MPAIEGQNGRRLILDTALPHVSPNDRYLATLEIESGTIITSVYEHGNGLPRYFEDLSNSWRGWTGAKTFASLEGHLNLAATHDGLGTVDLIVTIGQIWPPAWSATASLELGAGAHLQTTARAIADWVADT